MTERWRAELAAHHPPCEGLPMPPCRVGQLQPVSSPDLYCNPEDTLYLDTTVQPDLQVPNLLTGDRLGIATGWLQRAPQKRPEEGRPSSDSLWLK